MEIRNSINELKRIALRFVMAERRAKLDFHHESGPEQCRIMEEWDKAELELSENPAAKLLVPAAREYDSLYQERLSVIEHESLLGNVADILEGVSNHNQLLDTEQFKNTVFADDWRVLCDSLHQISDRIDRMVVIAALTRVFDALVTDMATRELPPKPKFTL